ncbi:ABC transporter permease [Actinokineospora xionganensis]|uniref:ABC transporter permease n=1 Tax=Actinokineospora xionganensis TaxID=2684470 RepID=A0ABR7KZU6_9PSEU|nr:ABC transporter permease [Actinokineospora xionganensis]MBC6445952.1 ABC transporter permease [Actinokineospora xionganensis]
MKLWLIATELARRPRRTLTGVISVALGVAIFLGLQAYGAGYRAAAREPLSLIGSDVVAQRQGDRPASFENVVFPHSTSPVHVEEVERVRAVPGVEAVAAAMFFWSFQDEELLVGLGIDTTTDVGPNKLAAGVTQGRFLTPGDHDVAVLDNSYAEQHKITLGDRISVAGSPFEVIGTVDTSRAGQVANANVYLPLADSQRLVEASPGVRSVHDIRPGDVNVLFVRANPARGPAVADDIKALLGSEAIVTTPQSFDQVLGPSFVIIDRFGLIIGFVALLLAAASLLRVVLSTLRQRRRDIAVLRAVGWTRSSLRAQLVGESVALTFVGLASGLLLSLITVWLLSQTSVSIPIPWELSPTPHFVANGAKQLAIDVPLRSTLELLSIGLVLAIGLLAAVTAGLAASRRAARIKPSEVWRVD